MLNGAEWWPVKSKPVIMTTVNNKMVLEMIEFIEYTCS